MSTKKIQNFLIDDYILSALKEDVTYEDTATNAVFLTDKLAEINLFAKEDGILAGLDVFKRVFQLIDGNIFFEEYKRDGDEIYKTELLMKIRAKVSTILTGERVALNFLQRMSGIASYTNKLKKALDYENILIMDTRKTSPNMRIFEKYAVKVGGGYNHRFNLSDSILIKDNHIDAAGSVKKAIALAKKYAPFMKKIEVETECLEQVKDAIVAGADIIMLDNMDIETIKKACGIINKKAIIECSGNIDLENISNYRGLDIDCISSGSMIYKANVLDLSMKNLKYVNE